MQPLPRQQPLLIDTHCHFSSEDNAAELLAEATAQDVRVIAVGGGSVLNQTAAATGAPFTQGYDWCKPTPEDEPFTFAPEIVAVGEMGFDFHYESGDDVAAFQRERFIAQAEVARARALPIIVHTREADEITVETLQQLALPKTGVIHSYTGNIALARKFLDLGYFISFSGIVTFRNADMLRESAKFVPDDRILVETDTPYLAPVPLRGKRNRPAYVRKTAEFLAALRGDTCEHFAALTTQNAQRLFNLPSELL